MPYYITLSSIRVDEESGEETPGRECAVFFNHGDSPGMSPGFYIEEPTGGPWKGPFKTESIAILNALFLVNYGRL